MIRGFERTHPLEPENPGHIQWGPAFACGLIAGTILLVVPRGSPWSSITFFTPVIMGRGVAISEMPLLLVWLVHLGISVGYGLIISRLVTPFTQSRAVLAGGVIGLV